METPFQRGNLVQGRGNLFERMETEASSFLVRSTWVRYLGNALKKKKRGENAPTLPTPPHFVRNTTGDCQWDTLDRRLGLVEGSSFSAAPVILQHSIPGCVFFVVCVS